MAEAPLILPEWQQQLEMASFIDTRKGDIGGGTQFKVYTQPNLNFVIKEPRHAIYMKGYRVTAELAADLTIPFTIVKNLPLKVNHQKRVLPEAILQEKVKDLFLYFLDCTQNGNKKMLETIITQHANINRQMLERGLAAPDPYYSNFGIDNAGKVGYLDLGSLRNTFSSDVEYGGVSHARGRSHYGTYLVLKDKGIILENGEALDQFYNRQTGLALQPIPEAPTFEAVVELERKWPPNLNLAFAAIGDMEMRRSWPSEINQKIDVEFMKTFPKGII